MKLSGQNPALRPYLADGVGLATGNRKTDYFLLNGRFVRQTFDEAFVEHVWLTDAIPADDGDIPPDDPRLAFDGAIPYDSRIDDPDDQEVAWLPRKWIQYAQWIGQDRLSEPNHFAVVFTATRCEGTNGRTTVASRFNDLWLFVQQIGNATQIGESLIHELGHEWRVNAGWQPGVAHAPSAMTGGHCSTAFGKDVNAYGGNLKCVMHQFMYGDGSDQERRDSIVGFHYVHSNGTLDSEYLRIRRRAEPVPQNEQQRAMPK